MYLVGQYFIEVFLNLCSSGILVYSFGFVLCLYLVWVLQLSSLQCFYFLINQILKSWIIFVISFRCVFVFSWMSLQHLLLASWSSMQCLLVLSLNCWNSLTTFMTFILNSVSWSSSRYFSLGNTYIGLVGEILSCSLCCSSSHYLV